MSATKLLSDMDQKILRKFRTGFSGIHATDQYVFAGVTVEEMLDRRHEDKIVWLWHVGRRGEPYFARFC